MIVETKPGLYTTEFWLSAAAILVAAILAFSPDLLSLFPAGSQEAAIVSAVAKAAGILAAALSSIGYTAARVMTKSSDNQAAATIQAGESNERVALIERDTAEAMRDAKRVSPASFI